jgi:uncharacterized protein YeaO (DUF488 family)
MKQKFTAMAAEYFVKRVYEPYHKNDGYRILVDRLWPRGLSKEIAHIDCWLKEIAPTDELRKWFAHDPAKWNGFIKKYKEEIEQNPAREELLNLANEHDRVTLLYSAKEETHNNAYVLLQWLQNDMKNF